MTSIPMDPCTTSITATSVITSTFTPSAPTSVKIGDKITLLAGPVNLNSADIQFSSGDTTYIMQYPTEAVVERGNFLSYPVLEFFGSANGPTISAECGQSALMMLRMHSDPRLPSTMYSTRHDSPNTVVGCLNIKISAPSTLKYKFSDPHHKQYPISAEYNNPTNIHSSGTVTIDNRPLNFPITQVANIDGQYNEHIPFLDNTATITVAQCKKTDSFKQSTEVNINTMIHSTITPAQPPYSSTNLKFSAGSITEGQPATFNIGNFPLASPYDRVSNFHYNGEMSNTLTAAPGQNIQVSIADIYHSYPFLSIERGIVFLDLTFSGVNCPIFDPYGYNNFENKQIAAGCTVSLTPSRLNEIFPRVPNGSHMPMAGYGNPIGISGDGEYMVNQFVDTPMPLPMEISGIASQHLTGAGINYVSAPAGLVFSLPTIIANPGSMIEVSGKHNEVSNLGGCDAHPVLTY